MDIGVTDPRGGSQSRRIPPKDNWSELVPVKALTAMVDKAIRQKDMTEEEIDTMRILNTLVVCKV